MTSQVVELLQHGIAAARAGKKQVAHQVLLQVTELDEQNEQAWLWLSGVVESLEDRRVCLENVLTINPDNGHAQAGLRWLDQHAPPPSPAKELCPRCQAPVPSFDAECPSCGLNLIITCPSCGQYVDVQEVACPRCGQILGDFRTGVRYYIALAQAYVERNRHELAHQAITWAEAEAGDDPRVQSSMAALYEEMGQTDAAVAAYERAIERAPENATLYACLGAIYRRRGMPTEAREMYQQALERAGDDPTILFKLAQLQVEEKVITRETIKLLNQVVRLNPKYAPAYLLLSDIYFEQGKRKKAIKHCKRACELTLSDSQIGQEARLKLTRLRVSSYDYAQAALSSDRLAFSGRRERPGCVTAYAILLGLSAVLFGLGGLLLGASGLVHDTKAGIAIILMTAVPTMLWVLLARGLWNLKNWARIIIVISQGLGFVGNMFLIISVILAYDPNIHSGYTMQFTCLILPKIVLGTYTFYWFAANGEYFD